MENPHDRYKESCLKEIRAHLKYVTQQTMFFTLKHEHTGEPIPKNYLAHIRAVYEQHEKVICDEYFKTTGLDLYHDILKFKMLKK